MECEKKMWGLKREPIQKLTNKDKEDERRCSKMNWSWIVQSIREWNMRVRRWENQYMSEGSHYF